MSLVGSVVALVGIVATIWSLISSASASAILSLSSPITPLITTTSSTIHTLVQTSTGSSIERAFGSFVARFTTHKAIDGLMNRITLGEPKGLVVVVALIVTNLLVTLGRVGLLVWIIRGLVAIVVPLVISPLVWVMGRGGVVLIVRAFPC